MKATAELQVIPIGAGVSVREEIRRVVAVLEDSGLTTQTHASGTDLEGDLERILETVQRVHEALHAEGTARLVTLLNRRRAGVASTTSVRVRRPECC
ncbi:MAG: MTH1187 family thiamine-binding protein [Gammaproteobacteria bacterium]